MKIFGREPSMAIAAINSLVMVVGTLGFGWFTGENSTALIILVNAASALLLAWTTRPLSLSLFTGLFTSALALMTTYGIDLPAEVVAAINAAMYPILAFLLRGQISPVETAVSNKSLVAAAAEVQTVPEG
jgi:hypothetical protein